MDRADLREIDHDQWVPFLSEFSKAHFGEPVTVRVLGRAEAAGANISATGDEPVVPLVSIGEHNDPAGEWIDVVTGAARPVSYVVSHPIHVHVTRPSHRPAVVRIDDEDGSTTLVRFLSDKPLAD